MISRSTAPVLQALTLDEILSLHPTDAPIHQQVWCCSDVINFARRKKLLWQPSDQLPQLFRRWGTMMLVVPPLDATNRREAGSWETIYRAW